MTTIEGSKALAEDFLSKEDCSVEALVVLIDAVSQNSYENGRTVGRRGALLQASDALSEIINRAWFSHRGTLQKWADEIQIPLHTAIPGADIQPRLRKEPRP